MKIDEEKTKFYGIYKVTEEYNPDGSYAGFRCSVTDSIGKKQGKLAFVMCSPRQDVLARMIINLQDAGFRTNYSSIYWTYASGFPKAANVSKLIDKRGGTIYNPNTNDTKIKDYLNEKRKQKGLSLNQINKMLGVATNGGGCASAYMGEKQENEIPTFELNLTIALII